MDFPVLRTNRLLLRQFNEGDLDNIFQGLSHPQVIKYYGINFKSREETREQIKWFKDLEKSGTGIWWAIISNDTETFCGAIGFNNLSREHRKAEIGFWLLPPYWGKGIIYEAGTEVLLHAFGHLSLHRIEGLVEAENSNSAKALKKLGFEKEGRMKDYEIKNGKFISVDIFARLGE